MDSYYTYPSPVGEFTLLVKERVVWQLVFGACQFPNAKMERTPLSDRVFLQIGEYFDGKRQHFDVPVAPAQGDFTLLRAYCLTIPLGSQCTVEQMAQMAGVTPAVVQAFIKNQPLPILVPCHRIAGEQYVGGQEIGKKLLDMELLQKNYPFGK